MEKKLINQEMLHYFGKIKIISLFCFIFYETGAFAQLNTFKNQQLWVKADKAFELGDYLMAKQTYEKLILVDSLNQQLNFSLGVCNFLLERYKNDAALNFSRVDPKKHPEVFYYLGRIAHLNENFKEAIANYTKYTSSSHNKVYPESELNFLIEKSNVAIKMMANINTAVELINLGEKINSPFDDFSPLVPSEENFMIFTSRRENKLYTEKDALGDYYENIYISKKENKQWQTPIILDTTINTFYNDAGTGISSDGEHLLLFRTSDNLKTGNIFESYFINDKWTVPQMLSDVVNSKNSIETSAYYASGYNTIVFSSTRNGGYGGKDLYMAKRLPNGNWGNPFNLGPTINTPYNEEAPFLHPSENVLYFASEGHENMGGYDIFKATFDPERSVFEKATNLGYPINTVNNDLFFILNSNATTGYLSSERAGGIGMQDIYEIELNDEPKNLKVYSIYFHDKNDSIIKDVELLVSPTPNDAIKKPIQKYKTNPKTGKLILISRPEKEYIFSIKSSRYITLSQTKLLGEESTLHFILKEK